MQLLENGRPVLGKNMASGCHVRDAWLTFLTASRSPIWCTIELGDHGGPLAVFWTMDEDETDWGDFGVELFRLSGS